ncbi:unnamed protein product [Adineta steineri]|uniref:Diphthamide biosynthesis protein 3 n=1 Tax=Adineta steineri TaxID=433720 RepID=A0A814DJC0_9BILA|nr:unnamed protein product [Adineta steineri]
MWMKYVYLSPNQPLPSEVILDKARRALNQEGYNLVYSNCEHFATECRYGQPNSRQVQIAVGASAALGVMVTAAAACDRMAFHDEVEIEDFEYDDESETYYWPCPCGDRFQITKEELESGEDTARCPSCSLIVRVIYDKDAFMEKTSNLKQKTSPAMEKIV